MTRTAITADEPEPRPLAVGGVVPAGSLFFVGNGDRETVIETFPVDASRTDPAGNVQVTLNVQPGPVEQSLRVGEVYSIARHCCPYGAAAVRPGSDEYICPYHGWQRL